MDELMFFTLFLCGDLLRRKKEGKRLTFREKWLFLQLVGSIANTVALHQKYTTEARILESVNVPALESLDEEEYDTEISDETAHQILLLAAACKEFKPRMTHS
jgi:hypothetical protein